MQNNIDQSQNVTCLVTAYNAALYIEEAIHSLATQTHPPAEIVLVDDGSTDDTAKLAKAAGGSLVSVITQPNAGVIAGRNRCLNEIRHPFVLFSDADDISKPDRISTALSAFAKTPALSAVFGHWRNFWIDELADEENASSNAVPRGIQQSRLLCSGVFRSDFVRSVGPFEEGLSMSEVLWVSRASKLAMFVEDLDQLVYERRIHHTNMSRKKSVDDMFDLIARMRMLKSRA